MEYNILQKIVNVKLREFLLKYYNSLSLYENEDVKNKLIHSGEYGMYKENIVKDLFKFALPNKYSTGTGFIYNSDKNITTQCDIILYDLQNSPMISDECDNNFFAQEVVYAIGEIKSKLTQKQLSEALVKLAKSKAIRKSFDGTTLNGDLKHVNVETDIYAPIFTFLLCDEITNYDDNIFINISKEYDKNDIPIHFRHNLIISLKNGLFGYKPNKELIEKFHDLNGTILWIPKAANYILESKVVTGSDIEILKKFITAINNHLIHANAYYPEPTYYL